MTPKLVAAVMGGDCMGKGKELPVKWLLASEREVWIVLPMLSSRDNLLHDMPVHVGQSETAALESVSEAGVVNA